jgi:hypothetical protein
MPAFAPAERPLLLEVLLELSVEVGAGMLEALDAGAADDNDNDELAAANAVEAIRLMIFVLLDCH